MADTQGSPAEGPLAGIHQGRLFLGSCLALIATAVSFAVLADIMGALKEQFVLTNEQVGLIVGAGTWGFTISIFVLGPLCDALGMRLLLWLAFVGHLVGVIVMVFAGGFWTLFAGALIISIGNGTVEAACNPLVATIYPTRKTQKLNQFHMWFPGGIVIGGLVCYLLGVIHIDSWQIRLCAILVPTVIYGFLFIGQKFPATERLQSGISFGGMVHATLMRPLFLLLFFCMMITASLELGPNRWVPSIHGILVLVWINALMAVLRFFAGPIVHRLSPTGVLLMSSVFAFIGLMWLSYVQSTAMAFVAATVFAVGVCYFWPTMLGVTSERVPRGGALALALMGGVGMLAVGLVTTPQMGRIADIYLPDKLDKQQTLQVMQQVVDEFPALKEKAEGDQSEDIQKAIDAATGVLSTAEGEGKLPHPDTANALRAIINSGTESPLAKNQAPALLNPADNYGMRISFRWVAPLAIILMIIFGFMYVRDKARGGYKAEHISGGEAAGPGKA